jgi:hypothetical protein
MPEPVSIIPSYTLHRGPDYLRGDSNSTAFIYTAFASEKGQRLFSQPGNIGHESFPDIFGEDLMVAMFGPALNQPTPHHLEKLANIDKLRSFERDELEQTKHYTLRDELQDDIKQYDTGPNGNFIEKSSKRDWSWESVRKLSRSKALYGRSGKIEQREVIMLWMSFPGWENLLTDMLQELKVPADSEMVVTVGVSSQFMARDFVSQKKSILTQVDANSRRDDGRLQALLRYHVATGAEKERLAKELGLGKYGPQPDVPSSSMTDDEKAQYPWKRKDWRQRALQAGIPGVFDYGESIISFKQFLADDEQHNENQT